jgi:hypothetical protein
MRAPPARLLLDPPRDFCQERWGFLRCAALFGTFHLGRTPILHTSVYAIDGIRVQ